MEKVVKTRQHWPAFGRAYGWKKNLYRFTVAVLRQLSGGRCRLAAAEILTASVAQLRCLARLPKSLEVRYARESDLPQLSRFVAKSEQATARLAAGDRCVIALCHGQVLATEWVKIGPAMYHEDVESLGVVFQAPQRAGWLYDGVSGVDGQALGPWGAVMGRLRIYLEARDIDTVYLQVGCENVYSLACHEALGFRRIGRVCCLRVGRYRLVMYNSPTQTWTWVQGKVFDLSALSEIPCELTPALADKSESW